MDAVIKSIDAQGVVFVEQMQGRHGLGPGAKSGRRCVRQQRTSDEEHSRLGWLRSPWWLRPPSSARAPRSGAGQQSGAARRAAQGCADSGSRSTSTTRAPIFGRCCASSRRSAASTWSSTRACRWRVVDLKLTQVPWDQVMDVVLQSSS